MMRNISFALTTSQFRDRSKTVTRRLGWRNLKPGDELMGCVKCQGLKKGESLEKLGKIRVTSAEPERLNVLIGTPYGDLEARKEGFPEMTGREFVQMFCKNMKCLNTFEVTRIEYEYL